ncbi:MAG: tyrosine--tRNA ligase [Acidimicrobiia bacterium]|nr:tyrosine--tRNA ligase [Acidimicrobiia bacterium]
MNLFDEFQWRGVVYDATDGTQQMLAKETISCYIGFDPTASSLHVGNLLPIMGLARLQRFGHSPIALVGGGTGMIGDPSGKSQERTLMSIGEIDANVRAMRGQLERFLDFETKPNAARMVNNADWLRTIGLLEFLRDTGKHFSVNLMMSRESVKRRLDEGLSFTEFSYQLLQAHDYLHLFRTLKCTLQMGGSDQWGNIVAGTDLIRRVENAKAHGLVMPLVTTSSGTKFGKTEAGTVWLSPERTSERDFYQFWFNTDDRDVIKYLKFFTWLDRAEIESLERGLESDPAARTAQRRLADEVTRTVHGDAALTRVQADAALRFGGATTAESLQQVAPTASISAAKLSSGLAATELLVLAGLAKSKSEAFRLIEQGGVSINDAAVTDPRAAVTLEQALGNRFKVARGRRSVAVVEVDP